MIFETPAEPPSPLRAPGAAAYGPQTTGRQIVVFDDTVEDARGLLSGMSGVQTVADSRDFAAQAVGLTDAIAADATFLAELNVAVVNVEPERPGLWQVSDVGRSGVVAVAPELIHHVLPTGPEYVRGYQDGVTDLAGRLGSEAQRAGSANPRATTPTFRDTDQATWGLQAVGALTSNRSGLGVRVAVLDTGLDLAHPDFVGRSVTSQSFLPGVDSAQDGHGHGTHCIGTSCGSQNPAGSRRYGIAYAADIFAGKVLGDDGSGADGGILAGINWAIANDCHIVSMSLGADVAQSHPPYNFAGRRALARGTLIIAAAGNNADRPGNVGFVGAPANSPDIIAVAAVDANLGTARFSARSLPDRGGQVDLAGPGVAVYSSWPMPTRYNTISGTSMATPHAAGIAALWAEATGLRGLELWATLCRESQRLLEPSVDVGSGLVQAGQPELRTP